MFGKYPLFFASLVCLGVGLTCLFPTSETWRMPSEIVAAVNICGAIGLAISLWLGPPNRLKN